MPASSVTGMLRSLDPSRSRPYRAPWTVDRRDDRHTLVRNDGHEPADFVRAFLVDGSGAHWGQVLPGEEVVVCLPGVRGQSSRVMLAWYRWRTDDEYCWAFVQ